ncbi:uncharacterized protein L201_004571 [Kwoniella dendrophila CBS 6074]|uniref:Major facilitator superfamily (MFS) profile domain-containing protein n=1 Tax=Kwoniella dendrophila CBS 6074 TaxID=1295534 RepID=A0AAX4JWK5_9TREE
MTWVSMNCPFAIFGGLLSYGLGPTSGTAVPSWGLLFLLLGALTIIWSVIQFFILPDSPGTAYFLTPRERIIAVKRVAGNRVGTRNTEFKWEQVREVFVDYKTYLMFFSTICAQLPNGIVSFFSTTIISSLGFSEFETVLLDIPYQMCCLWPLLIAAWVASRWKNMRALMLIGGNCTGSFLVTGFSFISFTFAVIMVTSNIGGYTKRQTVTTITFLGFCVGNIVGPHTLIASEKANQYPTATKAMIGGFAGQTVCIAALALGMWYENKRHDRKMRERGENDTEEELALLAERTAMEDATDLQNPYLRYVY